MEEDEEITEGFCVKGQFEDRCKDFIFDEFPDEKATIVLILEYFQVFLPQLLRKKKDYYNKPIIIDPKDIDLVAQKEYGPYVVLLSITGDTSIYPDEQFFRESTEYSFQIDLQVYSDESLASLENLIKLKSAVKTLLVNMDHNLQILTEVGDFSYGSFGIDESNQFVRQGIYTFSIQDTNHKK